ncbi:MAG: hypothetical protein WBB37_07525 [bacterium]
MRTKKRLTRKALEQLRTELQKRDQIINQYKNKPQEFLSRYGYSFPPKVDKFFKDIYSGKVQFAVVKSCRAGGKTMIAAGLGFAFFFFKKWNVGIVAGSKEQGLRSIEYVQDITGEPEIVDYIPDETKLVVRGKWGNWIKASPASTKAVRGLHARGRGMLLIMDEEAEMEEAIVRSALKIVKDAKPCVILRLSTAHKVTGTFIDLVDNHKKYGYELYEWDSFDVAEKCQDKCDECLKKYYGSRGDIKKMEEDFVNVYCQKKAKRGCGWLTISGIRQAFIESPKEWFEVEDMGLKPSGAGMVLPPEKVKKAFDNEFIELVPSAEHWLCIDWGYKGMTAVESLQRLGEEVQLLYSKEFVEITLPLIVEYLKDQSDELQTKEIYADSSHPFENNQLKNEGFEVTEVAFGSYKETGAGWLRYLMERELFKAPGYYTKVKDQLLNWRRNEAGKIIKKNDHHPDSLLAGTKKLDEAQGGTLRVGPNPLSRAGSGFMEFINKLARRA